MNYLQSTALTSHVVSGAVMTCYVTICHKHHNVTVILHTCTSLPVCKLSSFTFTRLSQFTSHLLPNVHMIKMLVFFCGMAPQLSLSLSLSVISYFKPLNGVFICQLGKALISGTGQAVIGVVCFADFYS